MITGRRAENISVLARSHATEEISNRICIIGAGSSGIAACKVLKDHHIAFDCYETSDRVGGNWVYENPNRMSSAYKSLCVNTSKAYMQYSDYPMPEHYPVFPHHTQVAEYFNNYVDHFGFRQSIRFQTTVTDAAPLEGGGWKITLHDGSTHYYCALFVANGHHWDPLLPDPPFPGYFDGDVIHSHYYRTSDPYRDKRVLVIGVGSSAMDIAVETSHVSTMTYLAVRRGFHVLPKYLLGKPLDEPIIPLKMPDSWSRKLLEIALRLQIGKLSQYGLPEPDHPVLHSHPTVNSDILNRIAHGRVKPKPNISRLDGDGVIFMDGTRELIDSIIYCTGYKVTFPFFKPDVVEVKNYDLPLFWRVFHPRYRDLFFIGLVQPLGAIMPVAEIQSIWVSKYLLGEYNLPSPDEMVQHIQRQRAAMLKRYGNSLSHIVQVDEPYVMGITKEMKRGMKRPSSSLPLIAKTL